MLAGVSQRVTDPGSEGDGAAPGWYSDPLRRRQERYWDGSAWTDETRAPASAPSLDDPATSTAASSASSASSPEGPSPSTPSEQPAQSGRAATDAAPAYWVAPPSAGEHPGPDFGDPGAPRHTADAAGSPAPGPQGPASSYPGAPTPPAPYYGPPEQPTPPEGQQDLAQPPGPTTEDGIALASIPSRLLAMVIDAVILIPLSNLLAIPFMLNWLGALWRWSQEVALTGTMPSGSWPMPNSWEFIAYAVVGMVLSFCYGLFLLHAKGATVGQLAAGIRVVPRGKGRQQDGLRWATAAKRSLLWSILAGLGQTNYLFSMLQLFSCLAALWTADRLTWHDLAAGTQVVKRLRPQRPPVVWQAPPPPRERG